MLGVCFISSFHSIKLVLLIEMVEKYLYSGGQTLYNNLNLLLTGRNFIKSFSIVWTLGLSTYNAFSNSFHNFFHQAKEWIPIPPLSFMGDLESCKNPKCLLKLSVI